MSKPSILNPFNAIKFLFKKPKTLRFPFEKKEPALRCRGFHLNDWETCTGCGNCIDACPRDIIELHPESHKLYVLCKNKDNPKIAGKVCTKACIACGICVRAVKQDHLSPNNLVPIRMILAPSSMAI